MNHLSKFNSIHPWNRFPLSNLWNEFSGFPVKSIHRNFHASLVPAVDIKETDTEYQVVADFPGASKESLEVSLKNNVLNIMFNVQEVNEEKSEDRILRRERFRGKVSRSFRLDNSVDNDNIQANYKNGVLTVIVPKKESLQARKIEVTVH